MQIKSTPLYSVLLGVILAVSCGKKETTAPPPSGPVPVPVETIALTDAVVTEEYSATLEGQQNVEIRPKVSGFIQKIFVDEGQAVKRGQLLFKLETQTLSQEASAAQANVKAAQVEVDRLKPLVERNIISSVQLETAKARLAQAKSQYGSISATIGFASITSPVDGVIGSLPYKEGSLVSATSEQPLTTVSDTRIVRAYFSMNEKQLLAFNKTFKGATPAEKLKNTPQVGLRLIDNSEYDRKGRIVTINGLADPATGTTQFRAEFPNPEGILRSGGSAVLLFPIEHKNVILVPETAVWEMQGKQMIFVVGEGNTIQSRVIRTNGTTGKKFIVVDGLQAGEKVVVEGASKLKDGMQVVPQAPSTEENK